VLGRPVTVDLRDVGLGFAVRDGFAWLRDWGCAEGPSSAMQRFAEWLRAAGAENFRIDVDGNVITAGGPEPGERWRVGIRHPWRTGQLCAVLSLADHAVATSANDRGKAGIVPSPACGQAAELAALTVVAGDLAVAEATAAAGLAMGRAGIAWVDAQPGCLVFAVTEDGFVQHSVGLTELLDAGPS
jgi:thiamine biosynthesis lipoprotein